MNTIFHDVKINAPINKVFEGVTSPSLLNEWWTYKCNGVLQLEGEYQLDFTGGCIWYARVTNFIPNHEFELTMFNSQEDWDGTKVGFILEDKENSTKLRFYHSGWKEVNEHFRISSYCWAVYLRILKGFLEKGIRVPYQNRDGV
jgi:uncharacterized protein YndB with AHSA1/START domain